MKRAAVFLALVLVAACGEDKPARDPSSTNTPSPPGEAVNPMEGSVPANGGPASPAPSASSSAAAGARGGAKEGATCAGIAGIRCAEGLTCKMQGPAVPDQAGVCAKP